MSESKADQLRAEMLERHRAELAAPGWKGLSNEPERHRARGDMDAWCDWCGDCAEDQPCRCCLAAEVEALRAQIKAVRELYEFYRTSPVNECSQTDLLGEIARVLGGDA